MTAFQTLAYEPSHREDYLGLLREAWGERSMSGEEFDWWFERNPAGSLMSVAKADGRVVGVAAHSLCRLLLGGVERLGAFSVHATTRLSARGQGIFGALELRHEQEATARGVAVVLAFASAPTAPIFLGRLGWREIGRPRVWVRPLAAALGRLARRPPRRGLRPASDAERTYRGVAVRPLARFGAEAEAAYRRAALGWGHHVIRDAAYLNWRYLDSPRGYRAFASPDGYAVVGHKHQRGVSVALLADLVAPPGETRALLGRCLAEAQGGAEALIALPPAAPAGRRAFLSLGFVPSPVRLQFVGKPLAGELDRDARRWHLSLGDTDFF